MRESQVRKLVVQALKSKDAMSVENPERPGTPDVNYVDGWIELKVLVGWPKRTATPVAVRCFTPQQRVWLTRRCLRGGRAHFLIRIGKEWLLFNGIYAAKWIGKLNKQEMLDNCDYHSDSELSGKDLWKAMTR